MAYYLKEAPKTEKENLISKSLNLKIKEKEFNPELMKIIYKGYDDDTYFFVTDENINYIQLGDFESKVVPSKNSNLTKKTLEELNTNLTFAVNSYLDSKFNDYAENLQNYNREKEEILIKKDVLERQYNGLMAEKQRIEGELNDTKDMINMVDKEIEDFAINYVCVSEKTSEMKK